MIATELFARMPGPLAMQILEHAYDTDKSLYRELLARLAKARRVHPPVLQRIPRSERHPWMVEMLSSPASIEPAYQCISGWLLATQATVLTDFLNAVGIAHDGRGCAESFPDEPPPAATIQRAVAVLLDRHPREIVIVYLHAFNGMPDTRWPELDAMLEKDPGLQFDPGPMVPHP